MTTSVYLINHAELALASYALLPEINSLDNTANHETLIKQAGITDTQFDDLVNKYPYIVSHIQNTESGFSTTVFQGADGSLMVAIRGTEFPDDPVDLLQADIQEIFL